MQLIDKAAVVTEINRRKEINKYRDTNDSLFEDEVILSFIDALEVKEVNLKDEYMVNREIAREKSILDETKVEYFATGKPTIAAYSEDNLRNQFDAGADWMKEQIIKALR